MKTRALKTFLIGGLAVPWFAFALVFFELLRGERLFRRDTNFLFYPLRRYFAEQLRAGHFPQWWPFDGLGSPLVAMPLSGSLHPTSLLYALLPFEAAFNLQTLLAAPVAAGGTFLLGRALRLRPLEASVASVAFVLSGYFTSLSEYPHLAWSIAALPWLWWGVLESYRSRTFGAVLISVAIGAMALGGDPLTLELGMVMAVPFAWLRRRRAYPGLLVAATLGLGLAGVQLLPMVALYFDSARAQGIGLADSSAWALPPRLWPALLSSTRAPGDTFLFPSLYLGLGVLAFAVVGLTRATRARWVLLGVSASCLWLAVGGGGLWRLFQAVVPGWSGFQYPVKAVGPASLCLALLAGLGVQQLGLVMGGRRHVLVGAGAVAVLVGGLALNAPLHAGCGLAAVLSVGLAPRRRAAAFIAVAALAADLGLTARGYVLTAPFETLDHSPIAQALRSDGVGLEGTRFIHQWMPRAQPSDPLERELLWGQALIPLVHATSGLPSADGYFPAYSARYAALAQVQPGVWRRQLASLFGTSHALVDDAHLPADPAQVLFRDSALSLSVVRRARTLPRAYVASEVRGVPAEGVVATMMDTLRDGVHETVVALDDMPGVPVVVTAPEPIAARVRAIDGDTMEVEAELPAPGLLVLNDAYFAGVEAVEGEKLLPVVAVNHAVRGVWLASGSHRVRFGFRTPGLRDGGVLSLVSVLGLFALAWLEARRRREGPIAVNRQSSVP